MKKVLYPNLVELNKYHPRHCETFADHVGVTPELYIEVLKGNGELALCEFAGIARLTNIPIGVLRCPELIMLSKSNHKHQGMIKRQTEALYKIWGYQKNGNSAANLFMKCSGRLHLVNLELAFKRDAASYCWYLGVQKSIDHVFLSVLAERKEKRGLRCR